MGVKIGKPQVKAEIKPDGKGKSKITVTLSNGKSRSITCDNSKLTGDHHVTVGIYTAFVTVNGGQATARI